MTVRQGRNGHDGGDGLWAKRRDAHAGESGEGGSRVGRGHAELWSSIKSAVDLKHPARDPGVSLRRTYVRTRARLILFRFPPGGYASTAREPTN